MTSTIDSKSEFSFSSYKQNQVESLLWFWKGTLGHFNKLSRPNYDTNMNRCKSKKSFRWTVTFKYKMPITQRIEAVPGEQQPMWGRLMAPRTGSTIFPCCPIVSKAIKLFRLATSDKQFDSRGAISFSDDFFTDILPDDSCLKCLWDIRQLEASSLGRFNLFRRHLRLIHCQVHMYIRICKS